MEGLANGLNLWLSFSLPLAALPPAEGEGGGGGWFLDEKWLMNDCETLALPLPLALELGPGEDRGGGDGLAGAFPAFLEDLLSLGIVGLSLVGF